MSHLLESEHLLKRWPARTQSYLLKISFSHYWSFQYGKMDISSFTSPSPPGQVAGPHLSWQIAGCAAFLDCWAFYKHLFTVDPAGNLEILRKTCCDWVARGSFKFGWKEHNFSFNFQYWWLLQNSIKLFPRTSSLIVLDIFILRSLHDDVTMMMCGDQLMAE